MDAPFDQPVLLSNLEIGVLRLTLNRPRARNALSSSLMLALLEALELAACHADVRAVVIAANGPAFCAGHDLKEMTGRRGDRDLGKEAFAAFFTQCSTLMQAIVRHPRPIIAEVQGIATAAGLQLVASCDLALASNAATFATPGVDIGLFCSTPMVALSRSVPRKAALAMLLTGEPVSAEEAQRLGLVNRVLPPERLTADTMALAAKIAAKPTKTIHTGKHAFYRQAEMSLEEAYGYATQVITENMLLAEAEEGICAFLEKREPNWP